jgi:Ca2+-binding EF-hand superfamily protein
VYLLDARFKSENLAVLAAAMSKMRETFEEMGSVFGNLEALVARENDLLMRMRSMPKNVLLHHPLEVEPYIEKLQGIEGRLRHALQERESDLERNKTLVERYGVPLEVLNEYEQTFIFLDRDRSGYLDQTEISQLLVALGESVEPQVIQRVFMTIDTDNSGSISFEEFVSWARSYFRPVKTSDEILNALLSMSETPEGLVWDSFRQLLSSALTAKDLGQLEKMIKLRPNGTVDCPALVTDIFTP